MEPRGPGKIKGAVHRASPVGPLYRQYTANPALSRAGFSSFLCAPKGHVGLFYSKGNVNDRM
jgi:hypothetical protein